MILNGQTVFTPRKASRAGKRNYKSWASKQRTKEFRTLVQGSRSPEKARCELDEFPMGNMEDSDNNNPQGCRLVNKVGNGGEYRKAYAIPVLKTRRGN